MMPDAPNRLGPYRLLRPLGAGGMGEVFLARLDREEGFQKLLALKRMRPELSRQPAFRDQFAREARLAAALNHPHLVQVLDYGRDGEEAYLAMKLVEGLDLGRLLAARRSAGLPAAVDLGLIAAVGLGCLRALAYAHGQRPPVLHGDIGPSNVLLGRQGEVKLADFGLARLQGLGPGPAGGAGKPAYLAPEVARGRPAGTPADLFGLGGVLLELATGSPPWPGPVPEEALAQARGGELALAAAARAPQPGLGLFLRRALAPQPSDRYPSAAEMLEDLERLAAGVGVDAGPRVVAEQVAALARASLPASPAEAGRTRVASRGVGAPSGSSARVRSAALWTGLTLLLAGSALGAWLALRPETVPPRLPTAHPPAIDPRPGPVRVPASFLRPHLPPFAKPEALPSSPSKKGVSSRDRRPDSAAAAVDGGVAADVGPAIGPVPEALGPGVVVGCAGLRDWAEGNGTFRPGPLVDQPFGPGVHALRLRAEGLEAQLRLELPATAGAPAQLALRSLPDAVVRLDGRPRGMTPLGGLLLAPGRHTLVLSVRGAEELALDLVVR